MWGYHACMANHAWDRAKFGVRMGPKALKNGPNSITAMGSITVILKTCLAVISSKSGNFDKLDEKTTFTSSKDNFTHFRSI